MCSSKSRHIRTGPSQGLLADLDGEEVFDNDYEGTFSDDEEESTDDDEDIVSGDVRSNPVTNQDVLNILGVCSFEELEANDATKEELDDDNDELEVHVNTAKCQSSYFAAVTKYRPEVFVSNVREEPLGGIPEEPNKVDEPRTGTDHEPGDPRACPEPPCPPRPHPQMLTPCLARYVVSMS